MKSQTFNVCNSWDSQLKQITGYLLDYKGTKTIIYLSDGPCYCKWNASEYHTGLSLGIYGFTRKDVINLVKTAIDTDCFIVPSGKYTMAQYFASLQYAKDKFGLANQ